jgi:hypothetical protein
VTRIRPKMWLLLATGVALLSSAGHAEEAGTQERDTEGVRTQAEEILRNHLKKLIPVGVSQLMRTQQDVDREQKRRASTTSNPQELALLADDEDAGVRFYVAANLHSSLGTLLALADDPEPSVRSGVAMSLQHATRKHLVPSAR